MPTKDSIKKLIENKKEFKDLKKSLLWDPAGGVDETFDVDQKFSFDKARSDKDEKLGKWFGVTAKLYNFGIGVESGGSGSVGNDDAQYIGICKCPSPQLVRTKEYKDTPELVKRQVDQAFGAYSPLSGDPVRFGVFCNAFNVDSSNAWDGIVEALKGDVSSAMNLGINVVPGLNQFKTPGAVAKGITELINDALSFDPVEIGSEIICDTVNSVDWYRKVNKTRWIARKWMVHNRFSSDTDEDKKLGWYLSQWFITLDTKVKRYDYAMIPSEYHNYFSEYINESENDTNITLAAVAMLKGEDINLVAERYGVKYSDIISMEREFMSMSSEILSAKIHAALMNRLKENI